MVENVIRIFFGEIRASSFLIPRDVIVSALVPDVTVIPGEGYDIFSRIIIHPQFEFKNKTEMPYIFLIYTEPSDPKSSRS